MKKFLVILFVILMIAIFNLINFSFEPLPEEKLQLVSIVLITIYSMITLGLSIFFRRYPKIKEIVNKLMGIISLFVLINLPLIFRICDMWIPLALLDVSLCIYYYRKYIKNQTHEEIITEEYMADKYALGSRVKRNTFKIYIIIGYILILIDLFKNISLFYKNNIVYFILLLINVCINLYIVLKSKRKKIND